MSELRTNEEWLIDLTAGGASEEAAIADLRMILLKAALYSFNRNPGDFGRLSHAEIMQLAEDCTQDALIAVMSHLRDFRGDSKFSTWAYKFAINVSLMAARHQRWKGVSLDELADAGDAAFSKWVRQDNPELPLEQSALRGEIHEIIQKIIEQDLTEKQRQVVVLMVFKEVPLDEVVRYMGSNRNSIYKLLHDARRKLKTGLQNRGFEVEEALASFAPQG